jgi:membrane protease YdiL (CAAX protease family)
MPSSEAVALPPAPSSRRSLGRVVTAGSVLVLLALVGFLAHLRGDDSRLARVADPERALALVVGSTMDVQAAVAGAPRWERRLYEVTLTDGSTEIGQAIAWYDELQMESLAPGVDLRLAILLGEAGRRDRLWRLVEQWQARDEPLATYGGVIAAGYLDADEIDREAVDETVGELGPGWFSDALALRLAPRLDAPALAEDARRSMAARAQRLLRRVRAVVALDILLIGLGLSAGIAAWRHRREHRGTVAVAPLPPPWALGAGLATLVRGGALAALVLLLLLVGNHWIVEQPVLSEALDQPLMYLPLLLLVWRGLLAPTGLGFVAAFGLWPRAGGWPALGRSAAVLVAAGIAIDVVLGMFGEQWGFTSHWTEWFDADLAWGPPAAVGVTLVGTILFAPVFEELIFRGLLYGTLRTRLTWPLAAAASALVFALAHGYGAAGFASVFLSGVLWAWVYERTGSLLPSIAAHMVNNAAVVLTLTLMLR